MHPLILANLQIRKSFAYFLKKYTLEELNTIPEGFNNNLFWNIAHVISVQQMIVIGLANQRWTVDKEIVKEFRKGSRPIRTYTEEDRKLILQLLESSIQDTQRSFEAKQLMDYTHFKTATGYEVVDFDSACSFNLFHEGLHMGYVFAIDKFLK